MTSHAASAPSPFEVRFVLLTDDIDRSTYDRMRRAGIRTEGYGSGRVITVQTIDSPTDLDALISARGRLEGCGAPRPVRIASVVEHTPTKEPTR